jgi:hypothetical protein
MRKECMISALREALEIIAQQLFVKWEEDKIY